MSIISRQQKRKITEISPIIFRRSPMVNFLFSPPNKVDRCPRKWYVIIRMFHPMVGLPVSGRPTAATILFRTGEITMASPALVEELYQALPQETKEFLATAIASVVDVKKHGGKVATVIGRVYYKSIRPCTVFAFTFWQAKAKVYTYKPFIRRYEKWTGSVLV